MERARAEDTSERHEARLRRIVSLSGEAPLEPGRGWPDEAFLAARANAELQVWREE